MDVLCGIDWAEGHHDVALVDDTGKLLARCRIDDDLDGYRLLLDLPAEHGDTAEAPIPVANRMLGQLHDCLQERERSLFDEAIAFPGKYRYGFTDGSSSGTAMTRPELTGRSSLTRMSRFPAQVSSRSHAQAGSYAAVGSWGMRFRPVSSSR